MRNVDTDYRCGCCDEIKTKYNVTYARWDAKKKPSRTEIFCICRRCKNMMKLSGQTGLKQMLKLMGEIK